MYSVTYNRTKGAMYLLLIKNGLSGENFHYRKQRVLLIGRTYELLLLLITYEMDSVLRTIIESVPLSIRTNSSFIISQFYYNSKLACTIFSKVNRWKRLLNFPQIAERTKFYCNVTIIFLILILRVLKSHITGWILRACAQRPLRDNYQGWILISLSMIKWPIPLFWYSFSYSENDAYPPRVSRSDTYHTKLEVTLE